MQFWWTLHSVQLPLNVLCCVGSLIVAALQQLIAAITLTAAATMSVDLC